MKIAVCCDCGACRQVEMADAPSIGDPAISKPLPSHHFVHVTDEDHHLHLRAKRDREDVYVDGSEHYVLQHTGVDEDEDGSGLKKQKLDSSMGDSLDDDPLLDDLKTTSLGIYISLCFFTITIDHNATTRTDLACIFFFLLIVYFFS